MSTYIGILGEKLALKYLIENGFAVISFSSCLDVSLGYSKSRQAYFARAHAQQALEWNKELEKGVKQLFGERWDNFLRFCEAWEKEPDVPSGKKFHPKGYSQADFVIRQRNWGFDYVAKKGSRNYFVEVKTNKAKLRKYQKEMMMKAKEFGFIPMIVRPKVSISARIEDVTIETF